MPTFGYGCAVFMQSDIVDFQRQGWKPEEIMAGLAAVLPKNIWLYVSQIPNLAGLGTNFVLQGGTQHNLAAVKAQVDFIESRFKGKDVQPRIIVHQHCGESGAIGAGIEAVRLWENGRQTEFIGMDKVRDITFVTHRNEDTRCYFCKNKCLRTFIDVKVEGSDVDDSDRPSKIEILPGVKRLIVGNSCERGLVEDVESMKVIKKGMDAQAASAPNFVELAGEAVWRSQNPPKVAEPPAEDRAHRGGQASQRAGGEARDAAHRHPAGAQPVLGQPAVLGVLREPRRSAAEPRLLRASPPRSCTRRAPSAARSTRASRARSASRTCTTCSTSHHKKRRSTSSSSR